MISSRSANEPSDGTKKDVKRVLLGGFGRVELSTNCAVVVVIVEAL